MCAKSDGTTRAATGGIENLFIIITGPSPAKPAATHCSQNSVANKGKRLINMCQRKIISKGKYWIVPVMRGCTCPKISEIHDTDAIAAAQKFTPKQSAASRAAAMHFCYDMHTQLAAAEGHHVVFRHCVCQHFTGLCMKLPPLLYIPEEDGEYVLPEDDDDEDQEGFWGVGGPGGMPVPR